VSMELEEKWPVLGRHEHARQWLRICVDLGRASRTIDAYGRGLVEFLLVCEREGIDPVGGPVVVRSPCSSRSCELVRAGAGRTLWRWTRARAWRTRRCSSGWSRCGCSTTS
jgi:hypothetical protein